MKKGFERLRGMAAASAIGIGLAGAGSARAATTNLPVNNLTRGTAVWKTIANNAPLFSGTSAFISTTAGFTFSPTTTTTSSNAFAIGEVSAEGFAEAFDNALHLAVNGTLFVNPDTTVDLTGDTITADTKTMSAVDTTVEFYFHPTRPVVRAMYSFSNNSGSQKTINVLIAGALSSDGNTTIQKTSANTDTADDQDFWRVSNDQTNIGTNSSTDPAITLTRFGQGAAVTPTSVLTLGDGTLGTGDKDNFGERYQLTIENGETARIIVFAEINKTIADATSCAVDFASLDAAFTAGMLTGLSVPQLNEVVNYGALGTVTVADSTCVKNDTGTTSGNTDTSSGNTDTGDKSTGSGTLDPASLASLLGLLALVRIFQKK